MMSFVQTLELFRAMGVKALPVPGTNKYTIRFADGYTAYVREATLMKLPPSHHDTRAFLQSLRQQEAGRKAI